MQGFRERQGANGKIKMNVEESDNMVIWWQDSPVRQ
jgi:hypothetical protein